ncbi:MAG TPA: hypothetical protein VK206_11805 [Anaerolineales bacterium]|nr:hypothetical protein [Anaerolineales bacterium]HLO31177.1 hypothetical protein [Anaerolineales bacterium]
MNKRKILPLIVFGGILGLCTFLYVGTMFPQDLKFYRYKKAFSEIHHPENTRFITNYRFLGAFDTQRVMYKETFPQGCDYIVGEMREYTGTQESIKAFYAMQTIIIGQEEKGLSVKFIPINQEGRIDRYGWTEYGPNGVRLLESLASSPFIPLDLHGSFYFVSVWDFEILTSDMRCLF